MPKLPSAPPRSPTEQSSFSSLKVSDLDESSFALLGELLSELSHNVGELSEERDLSFLAELYLSESMKGEGANKEAIEKIEAIAVSAGTGPFASRVHPSHKDGGGTNRHKEHSSDKKPNVFRRIGGQIAGIATRHKGERKSDDGAKKTEPTSVTLGYQADKWSIERIALDGIQNHLPSDSKGSRVDITYLIDGQWIDWKEHSGGKIEAIKFSDDGRGYSSELLGVFHSTKKGDAAAVGYFGEGLKMLSAACLREGIEMKLRSRDWGAKPFARERHIDGERIEQLVFEISDESRLKGSETVFWHPPKKLLEYVGNLDAKVLLLRKGYAPLYSDGSSAAVDMSGDIFARGVFISHSEKQVFGYDFDVIPNRDRDNVTEDNLYYKIRDLWRGCKDVQLISTLFGAYDKHPEKFLDTTEFAVFKNNWESLDKDAWSRAFLAHYGKEAVLVTSHGISQAVEGAGYKPIMVTPAFAIILKNIGVATDFDVLSNGEDLLYLGEKFDRKKISKEIMPTDLSLDYRAKAWGVKRVFLDSLSNHLPKDSGAASLKVEYLVERMDGGEIFQWATDHGRWEKIHAIRITDDGRGYSHERLRIMNSDKAKEAVGQFGEGLKMLSAACLREEIKVKFGSRDWFAMPVKGSVGVDSKGIDMLSFQVVRGAEPRHGSATVFHNPADNLVSLFDDKSRYFLHFAEGEMDILHKSPNGRAFSWHRDSDNSRKTYIKGVYVCDNTHEMKTIFNYDLETDRVFPDRDNLDYKTLKHEISALLQTCENKDMVKRLLIAAKNGDFFIEKDLELTLSSDAVKKAWFDAFRSVFGPDAVLDSKNPSINYEAEHRSHPIIYLNDALSGTLRQAGVRTAKDVAFAVYDSDIVPYDQLTSHEKQNLALMKSVDEIIGTSYSDKIKVFTSATDQFTGEKSPVPAYFNGEVYIRRDMVQGIFTLVECYQHEAGHGATGASDPSDTFRSFFERIGAGFIVRELQMRGEKITLPERPLDYVNEIKHLQAEQVRYAAMRHKANEAMELTAVEKEKLDSQYRAHIRELEDNASRLERELRIEKNKRWYQKFRKS